MSRHKMKLDVAKYIFELLEESKGRLDKYNQFFGNTDEWFDDFNDDIIDVLQTPFYLEMLANSLLAYSNEEDIRLQLLPEAMEDVLFTSVDDIVKSAETKDWLFGEEAI